MRGPGTGFTRDLVRPSHFLFHGSDNVPALPQRGEASRNGWRRYAKLRRKRWRAVLAGSNQTDEGGKALFDFLRPSVHVRDARSSKVIDVYQEVIDL